MSRLQSIENALSAINETVFQELCDSFLLLRNRNYSLFSRTGSQSGKQKSTKGTPDSFLLLPDGKYIFVEYSTNITAGVKKLKEDIEKCLDTKKTKIPLSRIKEIVLCINFNLSTSQTKELQDLIPRRSIALTIITLDSLALELQLNHRDLTNQYLGLPLDTGQVVSIENFINEYNKASKGIATPLDNKFFHREEESAELTNAIEESDFIILTGGPGVGKTKLSLEVIREFLKVNSQFEAYCISYKNHTLLEDLYQYLDSDRDYILFVDDANRIDAFSQIIGFYKVNRKCKLKVIITIRDYAFQEIGSLCQEFEPKKVILNKLSDEQITDIIKADPFTILNPDYQKEIIRIADGNPRLAIMTALLARAEQNIYALSNVSELFEKYFSTFTKDNGEFEKAINIKCLGLIAFFFALPYKNRELIIPILNNFEINYDDFIDAIDKLEKLELVEIQFEYVKIPEQNLSTYFFYKSFIKDNLLSFNTLLRGYFENNSSRFADCIIPANNTFGPQNVMDKLKPDLQSYWKTIAIEEEKAFNFLSTFWYYLQSESLEFIFNRIESMPLIEVAEYQVNYKTNDFAYDRDKTIELLGYFFRFDLKLKDVLELGFEFVRKCPAQLPELIHKIREQLTFDRDDERFLFSRQIVLFKILINGLNNEDKLLRTLFFELSKTFLKFKFNHTKSGRGRSFYFYNYSLPNAPTVQEFRSNIWKALNSNFSQNPSASLELLNCYAESNPDVIPEIMVFDLPFVLEIIDTHLTPKSFEHCLYVQNQVKWCRRNSVSHPSFTNLSQTYTNPTYEIFLKIDWDRFRDKEMYEFDDYREYEKLKEAEIRGSFVFKIKEEIDDFYKTFIYLKNLAKNKWNYNTTLDHIIDENCTVNFNLGCELLRIIIDHNNEVKYRPRAVFRNHLKTKENSQTIWDIVHSGLFSHSSEWKLSYFDYLDDSLITKESTEIILETIKQIEDPITIHFDGLKRYLLIRPTLFEEILKIFFIKNCDGKYRLQVWEGFFYENFDHLGNDIKSIGKAYLQQNKFQSNFDYQGKGLLNILKKDPEFLYEYLNSLYSENNLGLLSNGEKLGFIWEVDEIEKQVERVFDLIIEKEPYLGIGEHFCNSFFESLSEGSEGRAESFLIDFAKRNNKETEKMNLVVDIARHSMKGLYEKILLQHLSLSQDLKIFSKIWWKGNGGTVYSGDVIMGDIQASEWREILTIVEKSDVGIKLIPIKSYLKEQIECSLRSGNWERERRFLERF